MNSLVAYDDSDSETERTEDCKEQTAVSSALCLMPSLPSTTFNQSTSYKDETPKNYSDVSSIDNKTHATIRHQHLQNFPLQNIPNRSITLSANTGGTSGNTFRNFSLTSQKRPPSDSTENKNMVKPYIPKRLRQELPPNVENEGSGETLRQDPPSTGRASQNIFRVSDYLEPYLVSKYSSTEIPKNLVFQMSEHMGPVNRVQWCPVRKLSHLLLSASMDATVKIWDAVDYGKCLKTFSCHSAAVRDAQWSRCGQKFLSGGFDSMLYLTDIETGKHVFSARNDFKIGAVRFHPVDRDLFVCGGFSPVLKAWDVRTDKVINVYKAGVQQHFDILFLPGGKEFLSTTDSVSRDSADRTIISWDFGTAAKISNQIFHERYTCPSLALHPKEAVFVAQTNGNYMALFSSQRPYKMNKKKRFEGHKVEGFAVGCEFSPDGSLIVTGSSEGTIFFYNYHNSRVVRSIAGDGNACVSVNFHPVLPSLLASSYWDGHIRIWQ
ncbi:WD repeat-containing protein 25 [Rhinophrynus dorsalis]